MLAVPICHTVTLAIGLISDLRPRKADQLPIQTLATSTSLATATTPIDLSQRHLLAQAVACRRGERLLFQNLELTVSSGQAVWVRGPNGQGKTSLLRLLAGLSQAASGHIERLAPIVYIGHQHALKDDLTAMEALSFLIQLHGGTADGAAVSQALDRLGVKARRHAAVRTLSQGQRRRVALARLALARPQSTWILDEPFDALDSQGIATLNVMLGEHRLSGGSVVLTSHQAVDLPDQTTLDLGVPMAG